MAYTKIEVRGNRGWRGPHEGDELYLMRVHGKPGAVIPIEVFVDQGLALCGFEAVPFEYGGMGKRFYGVALAQPGDKWRANRIAKEFSKPTRDHVRIGLLLGYPRDAIRKFVAERGRVGDMNGQRKAAVSQSDNPTGVAGKAG